MGASKAQIKANNKWMAKAYDRINLTTPKGSKEAIQAHAAARGESTNSFICRAIHETMERDKLPQIAPAEDQEAPQTAREIIQQALDACGISQAELARRLGWSAQLLRQRLNTGKLSVDEWQAIGDALGAKVRIEFDFRGG